MMGRARGGRIPFAKGGKVPKLTKTRSMVGSGEKQGDDDSHDEEVKLPDHGKGGKGASAYARGGVAIAHGYTAGGDSGEGREQKIARYGATKRGK
jgi:hypothetical protein